MKHIRPSTLIRHALSLILTLSLGLPGFGQLAEARHAISKSHDHQHDDLGGLLNEHDQEIHFVENKGQFSSPVLFRADLPMGQAVATSAGMIMTAFDPEAVLHRQQEGIAIEKEIQDGLPHRPLIWQKKGHSWQMNFLGASPSMKVESRTTHEGITNYFLGEAEAMDVRSFQEVWYKNTYRNIDVRYYPAIDGTLEYDIICKPGSDPGQVAIEFKGIDQIRVNAKGELVMNTSLGEMTYPAPVVYQRINGKETSVRSGYVVEGKNILRFKLGKYDVNEALVIDPIALRWATWVNTASTGDNHGHCIWVDPADGAIYVVARVVGTTDQITPGAFDETANGNLEMIVGKYLEPANIGDSGTRVWQTYIGGNNNDNPYAMEQGADGNLYITGYTGSTNFPLIGGPAFSGSSINQQSQAGDNVFVLKINTAGNSIKAAVLGGNGTDDSFDLRIAPNGDVVVCGTTTSTNLATLNSGSGATNGNSGSQDALLFRLNGDLSTLQWMKNYGGSGLDNPSIMLLEPTSGDIFVGGYTSSTNFPTLVPRQSTLNGSQSGFLQRLNSSGSVLWSSYFQAASNSALSILCMSFNTARSEFYFGGVTTGAASSNISSSGVFDSSQNGSNDFFVARMGLDQSFLGGTYIGGSNNEVNMMGLNTDLNNDVYVFGYTNSTNFPVSSSPNVPLQSGNNGNNDKVFLKLSADLGTLNFSTYYGGSQDDYDPVGERGIKFSNCRIYTIVTSKSNNIPLTQGALNTTKNSPTSRYEPGLVVWANPPDLLGNTITGNQTVCAGTVPGDIIGSTPAYSLPTIVRNNSPSSYPSLGAATTYQWQISSDSLSWSDISGATAKDLPGSMIGAVNQKTYIRRIIGGDACILAGAADQVVTVKLIEATATITHVSCNGASDGAITASSTGVAPFTFVWSHGPTGATINGLTQGAYTVEVTDANGCHASQTFNVTQPAVLAGLINGVNATCNNSDGSASVNVIGGTAPYAYAWSTGGTGSSVNNLAAGSYTVDITDAHGCTLQLSVTIGSSGTPGANAGADKVITCTTGNQVMLNGSSPTGGVSYAWTASGGGHIASGANTATPYVDAAGTYTLVVTNIQTGCTSTDLAMVTMNTTAPNATASANGTLTCAITSVSLNGGSTTGGATFAWSGPGGFTSTDEDPVVSSPGTYTLTVTDPSNGCTSTASADVILDNAAPGAQAAGGTLDCNVSSVTLQGTGNGSYAWSGPNGFTSTDQNPVVSVAGTYTLVVTGTNGCTSTASADVILDNAAPGAQAAGGTLDCNVSSVTLQGTGNGTYAWSGPNGFTSTVQNPTVTEAGTYTLVVTGANGCTSTATAVVDRDSTVPGAQAAGGTLDCNVSSVTLQGTGNGTYAWSGPNGFTSTVQNPVVSVAGTYTLVVTGTNGCTSTASADVILDNAAPGAQAAGGTLDCNVSSVTLQGTGNGTYAWSGPNGFTSTVQNPVVSVAGTYTLVVTGTNGCTSTATADVILDNTAPGAQASGGTLDCNVSSVTLQGTGNGSFAWSGPNGFTSTDQNPVVSVAGTYTLVVTGTNGCTSTASADVILDNAAPGAQAAGGTLDCNVSSVTLQGTGNGTYAWSGPNGFTSTDQNPVVSVAGTYTLVVTGTNGCTSTASADVILDNAAPGAQAAGGTLDCNVSSVTLQGTGNGSFSWSGPNGFTSTVQNPTVTEAGTYTLVVTGANGCTSTATAVVDRDSTSPGAQATGGTLDCNVSSVTLQGTGNGSFSWSGPNGFTSTDQNPVVSVAGTYTLVVTGTNGCTSTASADVILDNAAPGAQAAGGTLDCNVSSVTLQGTGNGTYAWSGPNGFTSTVQNPVVSVAGTYTLVVTGTNGCTSTASADVILDNAAPGAQAAGGTLDCNVSSVTLQGTGNGSFSWSGPNGFTSTDQNPVVSVAGTYTLVVTGTNGCTSTATAVVEQDSTVPGAQAAGGTLNCNVSSVTLQGTGNGSFSWSGPNGFTSTVQNPTVTEAGTYTLVVTGTNGCTSTASADVILDKAAPGAQAAGGTLDCNVSSVTLQGTGNGSFSWSGPGGFTSTDQNPVVSVAGTYTLVVTGTNGCTSTATAVVDRDSTSPGAQATGGTLDCNVSSVTLQGTGNGSFAWSGPGGFTSTDQNPTVSVAGTYTLVVTGANGCTSTATALVEQDSTVPGAQAAGGTLDCNVSSVTLQGTGNGSFAWSGPNGFTSTDQNPVVSVAGTYTLVVTGTNGCTSTATAVVEQDSTVPGAQAAGGTLNCNVSSVTLQGTGNGSFSWSGPNGFTSTVQNPTVSEAGTYTLVVTGTNGCTSTATAVVEQDSTVPGAQAAGGTLNCNVSSVTLQGTGNGSFAWSGPNGFTSTDQNPTVSVAGTYTLVVTGTNGCTSTATAVVEQDSTVPGAQAAGGTLNCNVSSVTLQGTGNGSFAWSGPGGFTSTDQNPTVSVAGTYTLVVTGTNGCTSTATAVVEQDSTVPGAQAAGGTLNCTISSVTLQGVGNGSFSWSGPGGFTSTDQNPTVSVAGTYTLVVTGANGCTSTATALVEQDSTVPGAQAAGGTLDCTISSVTLQGVGNGSFSWSGPGGFTSTDQNPMVSVAGTYTLVVTGTNGCTSTATAVVEQDSTVPGAQAIGGTLDCITNTVTLQGIGNGTFSWTGPYGYSSTQQNPTVADVGTYTLVVTGANGCTSTATANVLPQDCGGCEAPIIISCGPAMTTVECGSSIDPEDIGLPVVRKSKDCPLVDYFNYYDEFSGICPITVTRNWTFRDVDGNEETCTQTILIIDTQAPELMNVPADVTVMCSDVPEVPKNVWAADCKNNVDVEVNDVIIPGPDESTYTIDRIFTATDACGNTASATQVISVIGCKAECETPIIISCGPSVTTVECGSSIDAEDIGLPILRKSPDCPLVNYFTYVDEYSGICPVTIQRTWTFRDEDGNEENCVQTINIIDTQAPVLSCLPSEVTVDCSSIPEAEKCSATDNCDTDFEVFMTEDTYKGDCESGYTITRTYTATDDCGNTATTVQTIHVISGGNAPKAMGTPAIGHAPIANLLVAPNPFRNESTNISFNTTAGGHATVVVMDMLGHNVNTLFDGEVEKGEAMKLKFKPESASGGLFFYRITLNGTEATGKIMYRP